MLKQTGLAIGSSNLWLPGWPTSKESSCNAGDAGDTGSIPGSGRSPGRGDGNPLQDSCLENPMDRGAWRATVHEVTKSWTQLKWLSTHTCMHQLSLGTERSSLCPCFLILLQEGGPLPAPETGGLLSNTRKWIVWETHVLTKQEILLGKGTRVESSRVREPRRTALPCGSQSLVLWWWD